MGFYKINKTLNENDSFCPHPFLFLILVACNAFGCYWFWIFMLFPNKGFMVLFPFWFCVFVFVLFCFGMEKCFWCRNKFYKTKGGRIDTGFASRHTSARLNSELVKSRLRFLPVLVSWGLIPKSLVMKDDVPWEATLRHCIPVMSPHP